MRTFHWNAPIKGAGALVLCVLLPALIPLKAEDRGAHVVVPVFKTVTPKTVTEPNSPLTELKTTLDRSDREVALRALQMALTELGDGATLVWRRQATKLAGRIKPLSVFRDEHGRLCRTVLYSLSRSGKENEIEGVACRSPDGHWAIAG
ncbi:RT0821/Lpp0805 family surface protein [Methyloceanibacter sp. wino2]|uniref:RT0821/Lpp0805 family surface protein n=1 Tax=Methyloceanibacter sp. wino2 TaxID=2170729 RepID=UPI000D3EDDD1|nr:RT0821/Lpp0805 family surface protein [Methyloceanibacter sp. wino2]